MKVTNKYDLTGTVSGKLTAIKRLGRGKDRAALWECLCECGATRTVKASYVRTGKVTHCGCEYFDRLNPQKKHGMYGTKEYAAWNAMKQRCLDENSKYFSHYGGRGIKIHMPWADSFIAFYEYMGKAPSKYHSIDRINNDGNYEPKNVRWATSTTQSNNRRVNRLLTCRGKTQTISEWARELDINVQTLFARIDKYGWSTEEALNGKRA